MAKSGDISARYASTRTWGSTKNVSVKTGDSSLIGFASVNPLLNVEPKRYERFSGLKGLLEAVFCCSCGATLFVNALATLSVTILLSVMGMIETYNSLHQDQDRWIHYLTLWDMANNSIALLGNIFIIVAWGCRWRRALVAFCPIMTFLIITYIFAMIVGVVDYSLLGKYFIFLDLLSAWFWGICIYYVRQILQEWEYNRLEEEARASGRTATSILV